MLSNSLSVYILTYNRAKYLENAIESVLNQTYENYDLYILDNCSTDETPKVINKFSDSRLHYIRHEKNIGGIGNIQFAINHCTTNFMIIFHDDDIMDCNLLKKEMEILLTHDNIAAVSCNAIYMNEIGVKSHQKMFSDNNIKFYTSGDLFKNYLTQNKWLCFPSIMYRHDFLKSNDINFQEEAGPCGDVILYCDIERCGGTICEIPDALMYYRQHTNQDSSSNVGIMQLMLYRYISSIPYYKNILEECSSAQPSIYRICMKYVLIRTISKNSSMREAFEIVKEFNSLLKHRIVDEFLIKTGIVLNSIFPKTVSLLLRFYRQIRLRRIK